MGHSLDELEIVVNPKEDHWRTLLPEIYKNEGWSFQEEDMQTWQDTFFKMWFYVALEKTTKKPVATVFLTLDEASQNGTEPLYSIGFFYTSPEWRGTGIGTKLFSEVMKIAGDNNVTLNGVLNMAPRYASKFGFDKIHPFEYNYGKVLLKDLTPPIEQDELTAKKLTEVPWEDVLAYDLTICPRKRGAFLKRFIWPSEETHTRVVLDSNKKIVGMACVRKEIGGNLAAGPVYADSKEAARLALDTILEEDVDKTKHENVGFLYPAVNTMAERLLEELSGGHANPIPFTKSQFTKHIVETPHDKVFAMSECAASFV